MRPGPTPDERYDAVAARDARFDGRFVAAVRTTGVYCRPGCPRRTPAPANVTFYPTAAAAHEAGYRACRRCLAVAAPGSPEWELRSDAAARAMRLIQDGVVEREGVAGLARRVGRSERQLGRILTAELGASPLALARAHRAHTARVLLVGTDLPAAQVAFAAGFASVRQFNDTIRELFGLTPLALRARRGAEPAPRSPGVIRLALAHREPIDLDGVFLWMRARAVDGVEQADADSYARTLALPHGPGRMRIHREGSALRLEAQVTDLADLPALISRARRLFDLDADPLGIDAALSRHPELARAVARRPGIRVPGAVDAGEMLMRAMIGQQISVAAARTALTRLTAELGERLPDGALLFPTMQAIGEHGADVLRGPGARIRAVTGAAAALAAGDLELTAADDPVRQRAALIAMPGIGPWTADYVRMRVTGDPDVLLPGDVAARTGAARLGLAGEARPLTAWAERTAPWRSYLTAHLWRALADPPAADPRAADPPAARSARRAVRNSG